MEWIQLHYVEVLAAVGGLYAIARLIVALTPTPRDDIALEKVAFYVRWIARLFGLDLKQGMQSKSTTVSDTTKPLTVLAVSFLLLNCSCGVLWKHNPRADLLASQKLFKATVESLTTLAAAGKLTEDEITKIDPLIHDGEQFLIDWQEATLNGYEDSAIVAAFNKTLDRLILYDRDGKLR